MATGTGTSGGQGGTSGAQRRLALLLGGGFAVILLAVMLANVESTMSDFAASGIPRDQGACLDLGGDQHVRLDHDHAGDLVAGALGTAAAPVLDRRRAADRGGERAGVAMAYRPDGRDAEAALCRASEHYRVLQGPSTIALLYEYRKDFATYPAVRVDRAVVQWLLARAATPSPSRTPHRGSWR